MSISQSPSQLPSFPPTNFPSAAPTDFPPSYPTILPTKSTQTSNSNIEIPSPDETAFLPCRGTRELSGTEEWQDLQLDYTYTITTDITLGEERLNTLLAELEVMTAMAVMAELCEGFGYYRSWEVSGGLQFSSEPADSFLESKYCISEATQICRQVHGSITLRRAVVDDQVDAHVLCEFNRGIEHFLRSGRAEIIEGIRGVWPIQFPRCDASKLDMTKKKAAANSEESVNLLVKTTMVAFLVVATGVAFVAVAMFCRVSNALVHSGIVARRVRTKDDDDMEVSSNGQSDDGSIVFDSREPTDSHRSQLFTAIPFPHETNESTLAAIPEMDVFLCGHGRETIMSSGEVEKIVRFDEILEVAEW